MLENLLVTLLLATYYTTTSIYCFLQLFPKRITSNAKNYFHVIVSFILIWSFFMIKAYNHSAEMTTLTQLVIFLNLSFLFKAPINQKLLSYFIYLLGGILAELLSVNIYIQLYNLFIHQNLYTALNIYSLCSFHEKIIIQILIFSFSYLFYKKVFSLLQECINYLKFTLLFIIILPIFLPLIISEFTRFYKSSNLFIPLLLYIICCFISYLLFIHSLNLLEQEQKNFKKNIHKIDLLKMQMEVSEEMKQEYIKIRKWNHDIENHLISLAYLAETKKMDEAEKYCNSVLLDNIHLNDHTFVNKTVHQEDNTL